MGRASKGKGRGASSSNNSQKPKAERVDELRKAHEDKIDAALITDERVAAKIKELDEQIAAYEKEIEEKKNKLNEEYLAKGKALQDRIDEQQLALDERAETLDSQQLKQEERAQELDEREVRINELCKSAVAEEIARIKQMKEKSVKLKERFFIQNGRQIRKNRSWRLKGIFKANA